MSSTTVLTETGQDPVVTKYYFHGGKRVAMDQEGVVQWLVGDHLGTTSLVLNANGTVHSEARHYPYGEERWSSGTVPTDYRFTGQRIQSGLGLYHMGARHYSYALGRWLSADTLVPDPGNPQGFNRYAYVGGNPLRYTDPSGHDICGDDYDEGGCGPDYGCDPEHPERCGDPNYLSGEMLQQWLKWFGTVLTDWPALGEGDSPLMVWTWDDGEGWLPLLPNPHFQLRGDAEAANEILLLTADIAADGQTIFGHSLLLLAGVSIFNPVPGDELVEATGAELFLVGAQVIDGLALANMAMTKGLNNPDTMLQALFLFADSFTNRTGGTYGLQLAVDVLDVGFSVLGDRGFGSRYGESTFYQWCERNCPDR